MSVFLSERENTDLMVGNNIGVPRACMCLFFAGSVMLRKVIWQWVADHKAGLEAEDMPKPIIVIIIIFFGSKISVLSHG